MLVVPPPGASFRVLTFSEEKRSDIGQGICSPSNGRGAFRDLHVLPGGLRGVAEHGNDARCRETRICV